MDDLTESFQLIGCDWWFNLMLLPWGWGMCRGRPTPPSWSARTRLSKKKKHCKLNLGMDTFHYIFFVHCKLLEAIIGCCIQRSKKSPLKAYKNGWSVNKLPKFGMVPLMKVPATTIKKVFMPVGWCPAGGNVLFSAHKKTEISQQHTKKKVWTVPAVMVER